MWGEAGVPTPGIGQVARSAKASGVDFNSPRTVPAPFFFRFARWGTGDFRQCLGHRVFSPEDWFGFEIRTAGRGRFQRMSCRWFCWSLNQQRGHIQTRHAPPAVETELPPPAVGNRQCKTGHSPAPNPPRQTLSRLQLARQIDATLAEAQSSQLTPKRPA